MEKEKSKFLVMVKHLLIGKYFFQKEVEMTKQEAEEFLFNNRNNDVKLVQGEFVNFTELSKEEKEAIFRKHSQGRVGDGPEDNQSSF